MGTTRRKFIRNSALGTAGIMIGGATLSAKSYRNIIGSNDRLNIGVIGLGRRLRGYIAPITAAESNVRLAYLCDVMPLLILVHASDQVLH